MIKDLLNKTKTTLSFEVFPPKTEDEFQAFFAKLDALAALQPDFINCTYGAGGSNAGKTIEKLRLIFNIICILMQLPI